MSRGKWTRTTLPPSPARESLARILVAVAIVLELPGKIVRRLAAWVRGEGPSVVLHCGKGSALEVGYDPRAIAAIDWYLPEGGGVSFKAVRKEHLGFEPGRAPKGPLRWMRPVPPHEESGGGYAEIDLEGSRD